MAQASIPVDLFNPGQVFACLGLLELADMLCGNAEGGFDWSEASNEKFLVSANGEGNPIERALEFLAESSIARIAPIGYTDPPSKKAPKTPPVKQPTLFSATFPAAKGEKTELPVRLYSDAGALDLDHWADGSSRNDFKLYTGNRSAFDIATAMLRGTRHKPTKKAPLGRLRTEGVATLWATDRADVVADPFRLLVPLGGSFNFDPRGCWTPLDAGYSPDRQGHAISSSPVVEVLCACGLQNARPTIDATGAVVYGAWQGPVSLTLARAMLGATTAVFPMRVFSFTLGRSGKNQLMTFAIERDSS